MPLLRYPLFFLLLLCYGGNATAQGFSVAGTVGYAVPILDNGSGFHVGVNPFYDIGNYFAVEGQVSYARVEVNGGFLSGEQSIDKSFNVLAGPRLYFTSPARKVRPFINALFGLNSFNSERINRDDVQNSMLGISVGAYANIRQFVVGLALETDGLVALKAGYAF